MHWGLGLTVSPLSKYSTPTRRWSPNGVVFAIKGQAAAPIKTTDIPPTAPLAAVIDCYWSMSWDIPDDSSVPLLSVPSGSFNLVFNKAYPKPWNAYLTGIRKTAFPLTMSGRGQMYGVRFIPGGISAYTDEAASVFVDRSVGIATILPEITDHDLTLVLDVSSLAEFKTQIEPFLMRAMKPLDQSDTHLLEQFFARVAADTEPASIGDFAAELFTNERHLQRLFDRHVGVSPKFILRTKRFQNVTKSLISGGSIDWAQFSLEMGYYDQSHFLNDFKAITGWHPRDLYCAPH